jgi:lipoprotein-releasing system permease protein
MQQGIIAGIAEQQSFEQTGIILGAGLASQLGVYLNDEIQVLSPLFNVPTAFG